MGMVARVRRRPAGWGALLCTLALLVMIVLGLGVHTPPASAAPDGFGEPPALPALSWPPANPILDSEEVGYLPGGGTVTAMGDYQYTLPIDVPDGRADMAPEIALRYSSRGGNLANGVVGVGWSLDHGGSEITRCPRTFLIDGKSDSPNWTGGDALCLDGTRMIVVNGGAPMAEGTEYRTFRDGFTRIVAHVGDGGGDSEGEPAGWFEAFEKNGRIRVYQSIAAKRLPPSQEVWPNGDPAGGGSIGAPEDVTAVWVLTSERDRSGNAILYHYDVEPGGAAPYPFEYRIASIEYTARLGEDGEILEAPRRKVVFQYSSLGERPDPLFHYQNGVRISVGRRLTRIQLLAPNPVALDMIGQYALAYEPGQERSFLASVHRLDDSGFRRMWERSFEWAHDGRPHFEVVEPAQLGGAFHETRPLLFDADNDGRADLLVDGKFCRTTPGSAVPFDACVSGAATAGIWGRPADVNGDGKADVLRQTAAGVAYATWNGATGTFQPLDYGLPQSSNLGDADGDGRIDAFVLGPRVNQNVDYYEHEWYLRLNTGAGFADPVAPLFAAPHTPGRKGAIFDLDGNSRAELHMGFHAADEPPSECAVSPSPPWDYHAVGLLDGGTLVSNVTLPQGSPCRKVLLDANGDGLKDIFVAGPEGAGIRYNTGTRFLPSEPAGALLYPRLGRHDFEVADIDGDGRDDLISSHESYSFEGQDHLPGTYLHIRRKDGFERIDLLAPPYEIPGYNVESLSPQMEDQSPVVAPGDVNGDGLTDLVVVLRDRSADTSKVRVLLQEWEPHDLVVRVWDEHSPEPRESVFYSPFTTDDPSPSNCVYPTRCLRGGMVVAREHWLHRQDVPSAIRRTAYDFDDLRMDVRGRGHLGFGKVRAVDLDSFAETVTLFDHGAGESGLYPFAGLPRDVWRITPILKTSPDPAGGVWLPGPGAAITARVSHAHHEHELRFTNGGSTHFVFEAASRTDDWEQHVALNADGLKLLDDGSATEPRIRHTSRKLDDFGTEMFSAAWTEGGQRCETTTVAQHDPAHWLIGLPLSTAVTCHQDGLALPEPRLQTMEHDSLGRLTKLTVEPDHPELSTVTSYTINDLGLVTMVTVTAQGELPRKTFLAYDDEGVYPRATWNALGHYQQQLIHPAYGVPILAQDPNGVQVRYRYDGFGRVREIDPDGAAARLVSYQQDPKLPWALLVVETREDGAASQVLTDDRGRTLASAHVGFDGQWIHEQSTTNRFGQLTEDYRPSIGQPPSLKTVTTFDTLGRAVEVVEPNGATTSTMHAMFESVTTDAEGRKSKVVRDADDRAAQTADLLDGQWAGMTYLYGAFGQLENAVDPAGNVVHTVYDKLGRRIRLDDPDRGTTEWAYNAYGEVTAEVDALGDKTLLARDLLGRVTSTAHDTHGITTFTHDGSGAPGEIGRLTSAASPDGVVTAFEYDAMGRPVQTTWTLGTDSYEVLRAYDEYSRLETIQYPLVPGRAPFVVKYGHNAHGFTDLVEDATDPAGPKVLWQLVGQNADGLVTESAAPNGIAESRQYDPATGRLTQIEAVKSGTALYSVHYGRDLTGNIVHRQDNAPNAPRTETFEYDELDRLHSWKVGADNQQRESKYDYDLLGNLTSIARDSGDETRTHEGQLQNGVLHLPHGLTTRTVAGQTHAYAHDARGRQLAGDGREIEWTPFDLPAAIHQAGATTTFHYDAFGRRFRKLRTEAGAFAEGTDTVAGLYERRWKPGVPTQHVFYVLGPDGPIAQLVYAPGTAEPERLLYLHQEALGSVGLVTDNQGEEMERTYFDPFGEQVDLLGEATKPELGDVKLGFTGHRHDQELNLIDMKGRVYDPVQKRFLSPDPYVPDPLSSQSYNRFAYVANNPLRYTDPTGFQSVPADLKRKSSGNQPDGGAPAAAPAPMWPVALNAAETVVLAKSDDSGSKDPPPPPPPTAAQQEAKWTELMKHMAWGAAQQLFSSAPPVAMARQIYNNFEIAGTALEQAGKGDWAQAASTMLEIPELVALSAARVLTGAINAAMALPATFQTAMSSDVKPEMRGAAAVQGAQAVVAVIAAVVGTVATVKATSSGTGKGQFGTRRPPHSADVTVTRNGEVVSSQRIGSGNMTPQEKALGFPRSSVASHTEARAARSTPMQAGDVMDIRGAYPPCPSCKGAMNKAASESGATIRYHWGDNTWSTNRK